MFIHYVVCMEILVRHNNVQVKNVNLGKGFSDVLANLTLDSQCRVRVQIGSKMTFNTDLGALSTEILHPISDRLEKEADNRILVRIEKRIKSILDGRALEST